MPPQTFELAEIMPNWTVDKFVRRFGDRWHLVMDECRRYGWLAHYGERNEVRRRKRIGLAHWLRVNRPKRRAIRAAG